jgi:hypothetical protein
LTWYDANGTVTTNYTEVVSSVYYITLNRLVSTLTASSIMIVKTGTAATISVELPADVQVSSLPLSGYYRVKCIDPAGFESHSNDISLGSSAKTV